MGAQQAGKLCHGCLKAGPSGQRRLSVTFGRTDIVDLHQPMGEDGISRQSTLGRGLKRLVRILVVTRYFARKALSRAMCMLALASLGRYSAVRGFQKSGPVRWIGGLLRSFVSTR